MKIHIYSDSDTFNVQALRDTGWTNIALEDDDPHVFTVVCDLGELHALIAKLESVRHVRSVSTIAHDRGLTLTLHDGDKRYHS